MNDAVIETLTWCLMPGLLVLVIVRNQIEHDERLTAVSDRLQESDRLWKVCILCFQAQVPWTDY